jgi:hypothetical protein
MRAALKAHYRNEAAAAAEVPEDIRAPFPNRPRNCGRHGERGAADIQEPKLCEGGGFPELGSEARGGGCQARQGTVLRR